MISASDNLRAALRQSIVMTDLRHARMQLRLVSVLLAGSMLFDLLDPALLLIGTHSSLVWRVATVTTPGPVGFALLFLVLGCLMTPYMLVELAYPCYARRREVTQLACFALAVAGLAWVFLAYRSIPLDVGAAGVIFLRAGIGALAFATALGLALNAELLVRTMLEKPPCA